MRIIREVGLDFDEMVWTLWQTYPGSDPTRGAATVLVDSVNHLYLVNETTTPTLLTQVGNQVGTQISREMEDKH
jgi:hypothetical protein